MRKRQTIYISFRATNELKMRLAQFCNEHNMHGSIVIRHALAQYLLQHVTAKGHHVKPIHLPPEFDVSTFAQVL